MTGVRLLAVIAWQALSVLATLAAIMTIVAVIAAVLAWLGAWCRRLFTGPLVTPAEAQAIRDAIRAELGETEAAAERLAATGELEAVADATREPRRVGVGTHPCGCQVAITSPSEVLITPCGAHDPEFVSRWEARL